MIAVPQRWVFLGVMRRVRCPEVHPRNGEIVPNF